MNINEAKNLIRDTVRIYLKKNKYGEYLIPYMKQRPIYLMGPPGVGKTAIIEQVAKEFNIPVVAFSMTHLSRDNAIGMPMIKKVPFGDHYQDVSEYTVSEIIASVYHVILDSKKPEGILFLDEINCVSESLAPLMLLFLQYKKFGNRQLPPGWVIVTAGNPPEYNKSVQEFDLATMDRLKYILVEPSVDAWLIYARSHKIHGAISAFLQSHKTMFYSTKVTENGPEYVTARGWEDLSKTLQLYEITEIPVSLVLIRQYLTDRTISEMFFEYYQSYMRYLKREYCDLIFSGYTSLPGLNIPNLEYENRLALINQCIASIAEDLVTRHHLSSIKKYLNSIVAAINRTYAQNGRVNLSGYFEQEIFNLREIIKQEEAGGTLSDDTKHIYLDVIEILEDWKEKYTDTRNNDLKQLIFMITSDASNRVRSLNDLCENLEKKISNSENFVKRNWDKDEITFFQDGFNHLKYVKEVVENDPTESSVDIR